MFTGGTREYADAAIKLIDPEGKYFKNSWSRNDCTHVNFRQYNFTVKDLKVLKGNYIPERTILVDNLIFSFAFQPNNGYLIKEFRVHYCPMRVASEINDDHFLTAAKYITEELLDLEDVRVPLKSKFNLETELNFDMDAYLEHTRAKNNRF